MRCYICDVPVDSDQISYNEETGKFDVTCTLCLTEAKECFEDDDSNTTPSLPVW